MYCQPSQGSGGAVLEYLALTMPSQDGRVGYRLARSPELPYTFTRFWPNLASNRFTSVVMLEEWSPLYLPPQDSTSIIATECGLALALAKNRVAWACSLPGSQT